MSYEMILSQNHRAKFGYKDNANMLVLGQVGTGKTRSHVLPNIMEQNEISMVIADTKGELRAKTESLLRAKGYAIKSIDFDKPAESADHFNPFMYVHSPEDVLMLSDIIVSTQQEYNRKDPYWDDSALLMLSAVAAYMCEELRPSERTLHNLKRLICCFSVRDDCADYKSPLDIIFDDLETKNPNSFALKQWQAFSTIKGASRTTATICSVLLSKFSQFLTPDIEQLTSSDTLDFNSIGHKKTALFVSVSDVDRSKDRLVSLFYSLLLNALRNEADRQIDLSLPVHVHMFLDDFATSIYLPNFDSYISCLRSREISFSIVLQSEDQLRRLYGCNASTIISNCAYYLFLGSNDLDCCQKIARRLNIPLDKVLYKPRDQVFVLSNFERPITDTVYDLTSHPEYNKLESERIVCLAPKESDRQFE